MSGFSIKLWFLFFIFLFKNKYTHKRDKEILTQKYITNSTKKVKEMICILGVGAPPKL